jgi:hypothetical protein
LGKEEKNRERRLMGEGLGWGVTVAPSAVNRVMHLKVVV